MTHTNDGPFGPHYDGLVEFVHHQIEDYLSVSNAYTDTDTVDLADNIALSMLNAYDIAPKDQR